MSPFSGKEIEIARIIGTNHGAKKKTSGGNGLAQSWVDLYKLNYIIYRFEPLGVVKLILNHNAFSLHKRTQITI